MAGLQEPINAGATGTVKIGPFVSATDGKTPMTALTIAQADVILSKNNGSPAQKNESSSAVHDENGWYDVALDGTDTGTPGQLVASINVAGALPVWRKYSISNPS